MQQITKLTDQSKQRIVIVATDGTLITFNFYYSETQECWNVDVSTASFLLNGIQLVNSPNLLRNYRNIINFGLFVNSTDRLDPQYLNDFASGRVSLYLLSALEVEAFEAGYYT